MLFQCRLEVTTSVNLSSGPAGDARIDKTFGSEVLVPGGRLDVTYGPSVAAGEGRSEQTSRFQAANPPFCDRQHSRPNAPLAFSLHRRSLVIVTSN